MKPLRCGVAGLGRGRQFVDIFDKLPNCQTVAVCDSRDAALADYGHLAAHTELDSRQPWNTSITLTREGGGRLLAADVVGLDLQARLVVLTGCTTVGSRLVGGEGLIGLTGAFLAAGAPTVLATLWPVDDAAAMRVRAE